VIEAEALKPLPPWVEVTRLVVLFWEPLAVAKRLTIKLQVAAAASDPPDRLTLFDPAVAAIVPPPQLPVRPLGVATSRPAGRVSVKPIPVREAPVLGLDRTKVSEVLPFTVTWAAPNDFEIVGGRMVGGGDDPPEEPPPQLEAHKSPRAAPTHSALRRHWVRIIMSERQKQQVIRHPLHLPALGPFASFTPTHSVPASCSSSVRDCLCICR